MTFDSRVLLLPRVLAAALLCAVANSGYAADPDSTSDTTDKVDLGTIGTGNSTATPIESVDIYATRGTASAVAPTQANLDITEPQSIISRAFIDSSVPRVATSRTSSPSSQCLLGPLTERPGCTGFEHRHHPAWLQ